MDAVELTRQLIAMDTINPPGNERDCAHFLGELMAGAGFAVSYHEFAEARTTVVAKIGGAGEPARKPLGFAGHIDTVPLGTREWSVDPFGGEIADGKLYGRGVTDMKAGIAAFAVAGIECAEALSAGAGAVMIMAAGEETGCKGTLHLAQAGDAIGEVGALVVAEPSYNIPRVGHKGALWMEMSSAGKTAHGSMPWEGDNALYKASRAVGKLEDFDFNVAPHAFLGGNSINVGTMHAGQNVNSVPDSAKFRVDVRTIPGMDHNDIRKTLAGYLGEDVADVAPFVDVGGVWTDPEHPWVQRVFDIVTPHLGERPEVGALPFFTDASALTPAYGGVPTLILGPGDTHMAHQTDEFCMVERIPQVVAMYNDIIADWLAG
jgi:succinyl-diaminopimelate desuccinylase